MQTLNRQQDTNIIADAGIKWHVENGIRLEKRASCCT